MQLAPGWRAGANCDQHPRGDRRLGEASTDRPQYRFGAVNCRSGFRPICRKRPQFAANGKDEKIKGEKDNWQKDNGKGLACSRVTATPLRLSQRELRRHGRVTEVCRSRATTISARARPMPGPAIGEATRGARQNAAIKGRGELSPLASRLEARSKCDASANRRCSPTCGWPRG